MGIFHRGNLGHFSQGKPAATESHYPILMNYKVHAGSYHVSVIHQSLTWTAESLRCVRDHSYACVYTRELGTPTVSQHSIFDSEKVSQIFLVLLTGFDSQVFGSRV